MWGQLTRWVCSGTDLDWFSGEGRSNTRDLIDLAVLFLILHLFLGFPSFLAPFPHTHTHTYTLTHFIYTYTPICHQPTLLGSLQYQQETVLCVQPNNPNDLQQERSRIPIEPTITPIPVLFMTRTTKTIKRCARKGA